MTERTKWLSLKRLRHFLALIGVGAIGIAGCTPDTINKTSGPIADDMAPRVPTIGELLQSDPRFADFVRVIDFAGLEHKLNDDHNVTVFAPTNAAFQHAVPNWRATASPDTLVNGGGWSQKRQLLIEQAFLDGVHPPSDFAGKMQDVRARNGSIFHVDGRRSGVLSITTGSTTTGMGYDRHTPRTAEAEMPPIVAQDGIIYPVDNILIR